MSVTRFIPKKAVLKLEMDESLKIRSEYMHMKVIDVNSYIEAFYFFQEWAGCVKEGLSQHWSSTHTMLSWLACMSRYLHVQSDFVGRTERIVMIDRCLPRLLEVLEHYTPHPVYATCHEVCRAVVKILRTMADLRDDRKPYRFRAICSDAEYQPCAEGTREYADGVMKAYWTRLTADEQYLRLFPADFDHHPAKMRDVENLRL